MIEVINDPSDLKPKQSRIDYHDLAERYNALSPGRGLSIPSVSNITHFKCALERRDLREGEDFKAWNDAAVCKIQRRSRKPMRLI